MMFFFIEKKCDHSCIVLLQPKTEMSVEAVKRALEQVRALQEVIPGIIDVQVGENRSNNHQGYTVYGKEKFLGQPY